MSGFFSIDDIRVVISIDFGTTFSDGKAYGKFKTNTVLRYDDEFDKVLAWGAAGLAKNPNNKKKNANTSKPVELFKLALGNLADDLKPDLPPKLHIQKEERHKKAITDYLEKMGISFFYSNIIFTKLSVINSKFILQFILGEVIKQRVKSHWDIDFYENTRLIFTIPVAYSYKAKKVMRECAFKANLIANVDSDKLQFTTEPEAAAIYCITKKSLKDNFLNGSESSFLIVDCGGGTVDLTTQRAGDFCGSTFIDKEFLKFLGRIVGQN
ncbi:13230_t:CDS:2, partial [Dentiscutata heterogama]